MLSQFHKIKEISSMRIFSWFLVLFTVVLLNGCSHTSRKDGPPNFYVDESKIPNAVPKLEALSRYGNMNHYTVFGKRYYVMKTSRNYEEQGIASWYGTKFHSHHTSNGERYDMLAMTAAHKTLPLPTYVEVTNLKNGKKIIVKVNDRGPFESNRLIDLSYVAAKKLGMIGHGTTHVDVKAIDPRDALAQPELWAKNKARVSIPAHDYSMDHYLDKSYAESQARKSHTKPMHTVSYASVKKQEKSYVDATLYLQVGAFHTKSHAEKLRKKLVALLGKPVTINPSSRFFRVQVGPFKDVASANRASLRLKSVGLRSERITESFDITHEL
jgi:rare lipoprotein A